MDTFQASLCDLQPSQLYISSEKLAEVERRLEESPGLEIDPVPVKRLGSRTVLTDGHTRALTALRHLREFVPAYWETDELDWEGCRVCVDWCLREDVNSVGDLATRIITASQYEELWINRCRAMHEELASRRAGGSGK